MCRLCHSGQVFKWDTGEDTVVARTPHRKCWSAPMTAEGVGVNRDSPVSKSNKPLCDTAVTGQPDNATQRAKQTRLTHTGCLCSLCPWQSQNKWPHAYRCNRLTLLAYSHLHYHHLSCVVWQPNILVGVCSVCYVCTSQNKGKLHSLSHLSLWTTTPVLWLSMIASSSCEKLSSLHSLPFPPPALAAAHLCTTCVLGLIVIYYYLFLQLYVFN